MEDETLKEQANKILEQLTLVRNEFIKNKDELAVSIRKDVVAVELKNLLAESKDYNSLKDNISAYITKLLEDK